MFIFFSLLRIKLIKTIKNGFTNSIGWNLGKKYKSIHLWALFTSMPIIGTRNREIRENKKMNGVILKRFSSLIRDKIKIIIIPRKTKDKCLKKKA